MAQKLTVRAGGTDDRFSSSVLCSIAVTAGSFTVLACNQAIYFVVRESGGYHKWPNTP
jgi:hypothetical protein